MPSLPRHEATRYLVPLREGGSLPAVVETASGDLFVVKFRGAGQGAKALVAEVLVAGLADVLGLPVPELALVELDAEFGRTEPDPEIQDILRGSLGANLGMRYLDGALNFDPVAAGDLVDETLASTVVWLDALVTNPDRSAKNPNMLVHEERLWLIDHGAALFAHHDWSRADEARARTRFELISEHVLLDRASVVERIDREAPERLSFGRSGRGAGPGSGRLPRGSDLRWRVRRRRGGAVSLSRLPDDSAARPATLGRGGRRGPPTTTVSSTSTSLLAPMTDWIDYDFAVVRVVPHVHLYEASAVGVIVHARTVDFIDARVVSSPDELKRVAEPGREERLARYLRGYQATARGDEGAGPMALLPPSERFHWLTAPRSDLIQCSPVHSGRTKDPAATLAELFRQYVG